MRYLIGFMFLLAGLAALPLSASAQAVDEGTEPNVEEPAPTSEPAPEEPALELKLDVAGVEVAPSPPRTPEGYTLEEMELRKRRARASVAVSVISFAGGVAMMGAAFSNVGSLCVVSDGCRETPTWVIPVAFTGTLITIGSLVGIMVSGRRLAHSKERLRRLR